MNKLVNLCFIAMSFAIFACNGSQDKQAANENQAEDSLVSEKQDNVLTDQNLAIINETGFSKYAKIGLPKLDWNKFTVTKFWQEDFHNKSAFEPDKNYFNYYGDFLKYSPDSTKFIDLDSYNISISRSKTGKLIGGPQEPDTEVSLVDIKKKEKLRLVFLGPGNSVEDAAWIDNDNLILIGYLENDSASGTNAAIWQFNISSGKVNLYELSDETLMNQLKNYSERERLKNVLMK